MIKNIVVLSDEISDIIADIEVNDLDAKYAKDVIRNLRKAQDLIRRENYKDTIEQLFFAADVAADVANRKDDFNYLNDDILPRIYDVINEIKPGSVTSREDDRQYVF